MIFKNAEAFESLQVLSEASETGRLGFVIAKNRRKFLNELHEYCEIKDGLASKYGKITPDGKFVIEAANVPDYLDELRPYEDIESDIAVTKVDEETFISGTLTSKQMFVLEWMIEDENDQKKEGN